MEDALAGLMREKCIVYLDDLLVMGKTLEEHLSNLRDVCSCLDRAGLKLKTSKGKLLHREVDFLGYVVSAGGVAADPNKGVCCGEFSQTEGSEVAAHLPRSYFLLP